MRHATSVIALVIACLLLCRQAGAAEPKATATPAKAKRQGALVLSSGATATPSARALARQVYATAALRPRIDEATAEVLMGGPPGSDKTQRDIAQACRAARDTKNESVQRRLLTSLGNELAVHWVVWVQPAKAGPVARVLNVSKGRFLAVLLAPKTDAKSAAKAATSDWSDAVAILSGLHRGKPAPGPRTTPSTTSGILSKSDKKGTAADTGRKWWSSPLFWGGLGAVVAVGVTVLVLSQTVLNDPGTARLTGRVTP